MTGGCFSFLITGAGRGGTSLLAGLLGSHPALAVGFERHAPELLGTAAPSGGTVAERLARFRAACAAEAATQARPWGNKITTEQIAGLAEVNAEGLDLIDAFYGAHRDLPQLFILRDGRTCVRSKVARTGQPLELACRRWQFSVEIYRRFLDGRIAGTAIRFEDLLRQPAAALEPVCAALGVAFDEAMLRGTDHPGMITDYRRPELDASKAEAQESLPADALAMIADDLRFCGYA